MKKKNWQIILPIITIIYTLFIQSCGSGANPEPDQVKSSEESAIDKLVTGKLAYSIPDTMKVGKVYKAVVSATEALNDSILFMNLDSSEFIKKEIKIFSKVKASLIDPSNGKKFTIMALNSEEQFVDATSNTTWAWNITPIKKGENELMLRVTVKILSYVGEVQKDVPVFEKTILVKASPLVTIKAFFINYWQWIFGTILIPFVIWFFKTGKEKKKRRR
jgi:hypothetical protein